MAIEDVLDQLYAEVVAANILVTRMWGYMAIASQDRDAFIARHRKMTLESVGAWQITGHRNPDNLRRMIQDSVNRTFNGLIFGPPAGTPKQ